MAVKPMAERAEDKGKAREDELGCILPEDVYTKEVVACTRKRLRKLLEEVEQEVGHVVGAGGGAGGTAKGKRRITMDKEVEYFLLAAMDNFIVTTTRTAATLAAHRGASEIGIKDVELSMEMEHGLGYANRGKDNMHSTTASRSKPNEVAAPSSKKRKR